VFLSDLPPRPKTGTFLEGHKGSIDHIKMGISVMPYIYGIGYSHINDGIYGIDGIYIYMIFPYIIYLVVDDCGLMDGIYGIDGI
jgi:L-rhamnose isomerase